MYLYSNDGMPSSGKVIMRNGQVTSGWIHPMYGNMVHAQINYTGKTTNVLTGCTVEAMVPLNESVAWETNAPVFMADQLNVSDTTAFASSGEILVGDEVMTYTSKGAGYFQLDNSLLYVRSSFLSTTASGSVSVTATSITASSSLSGWENSGVIYVGDEYIYYGSKSGSTFQNCQRGEFAKAHDSGTNISQMFLPELHPNGVLVKQNTDGAVDSTDSSIKVNGVYQVVIQEPNVVTKEQVESYASNLLRNNRWGSIIHQLYAQDVGGDFDVLSIGDKVQITDSTIGISGSEGRVMELNLNLNREEGYSLLVTTMPYIYAFNTFDLSKISLSEYLKMSNNSRWV
jgi:hypothetical protein